MSRQFAPAHLLALVGCLLASPAWAQDDPFEDILANPEAVDARLNEVELPTRNPSREELRQYLESFRAINLETTMTVDDHSGKTARLGAFKARNGSKIRLKAEFTKRRGEREAVLRTLELQPSQPMSMGAIRFNRMTLDSKGVLHFKLNLRLMGVDFWPQELTVEKIYKDRHGNLVFKTGGSGLAGSFVPDFRIKPDGTLQRWDRGVWFFGWRGSKWKNVKEQGKTVKLPDTLPIDRWPPRATDLLDWLPKEGALGSKKDMGAFLESIPVSEMSTRFTARAGNKTIRLDGGRGTVRLDDHKIDVTANGRFRGRTYEADPTKPNTFSASGRLSGEVRERGLGSAMIDGATFTVRGTHDATIPFEDLDKLRLDARYRGGVSARLSRVRGEIPGGGTFSAPRNVNATSSGSGKVTLRPLSSGEKAKVTLNKDNRFRLTVDGPLGITGLEGPGGMVVPRVDLRKRRGSSKPVLVGEGSFGNRSGGFHSKAEFTLDGETTNKGMIYLLNGKRNDVSAVSELRPGARVTMRANALVGVRKDLKGAAVSATADVRIRGTGEKTRLKEGALEAELPGATDIDARLALNAKYRTRNKEPYLAVRRAAASMSMEAREGGGTFKASQPNGAEMRGRIERGTRFGLETGKLALTPDEKSLESEDFARGKRNAKFSAHLVIGGATMAYKDLAVAFNGKTTVDLSAAVGFRIKPASIVDADSPLGDEPIRMKVDLSVDFSKGDTIVRDKGATISRIKLRGTSRITAKATVLVDPQTGVPTLTELKGIDLHITAAGIDLRNLLQPLGIRGISINSRTTVKVRKAKVEFLERGFKITHRGMSITIAPGSIHVR